MHDLIVPIEVIRSHRHHTHRLSQDKRLLSLEMAVEFINEREIIAFWPINGIPMPSLWSATAGDRPVPDEHDDPGHVTWGWKDELLGNKRCFYARIFCRRNFFVSLEYLPYVYTLSNNYGDPSEEHYLRYQSGNLSRSAFNIYDKLLKNGAMDTISLKREVHLSGKDGDQEFNRAIDHLQMQLMILPTGISRSGGWHYSFIYDLVPRHFPGLIEQCRFITDIDARKRLLQNFFSSNGFSTKKEIASLFKWKSEEITATLDGLLNDYDILTVQLLENNQAISGYKLSKLI